MQFHVTRKEATATIVAKTSLPKFLWIPDCENDEERFRKNWLGELCFPQSSCVYTTVCDGIYDFLLSRSRIGTYYVELRLRGSGVLGLTCCFYPCGDAPLLSRHGDLISHRAKFMMWNPVAMAAQQRLVRLTKAPLRLFKRGSNCGINVIRGFLSGIVMG